MHNNSHQPRRNSYNNNNHNNLGNFARESQGKVPHLNSTKTKIPYKIFTPAKSKSSPNRVYQCFAPPGPLGIVIETTSTGPMIYSVKRGSPLEESVMIGDVILMVDNVDTQHMTAAKLTQLMDKKSQQNVRKLTIMDMVSSM